MILREYQQRCVEDCIAWVKKSIEPAVVDATVSFGKSVVIAELARRINELSGKSVLILCPSGNLATQNSGKLNALGVKHSMFSASVGQRSLRHPIVVATPLTVKNYLSRFRDQFAAILIDEGDGITESVKMIVNQIKSHNKNIRVIGFTGTPFRTTTGYIYAIDLDGNPMPPHKARDPFYTKLIHRTSTRYLMDQGYLTPMIVGQVGAGVYDTGSLKLQNNGKFKQTDVDQAYHGHGRKTAGIVADIVAQSQGRAGVMIFGATLQHCKEIMASLPPELSRMVGSNEADNAKTIQDFKDQKFKYMVNKDMLTVGADFPHVDVIAVLRKSESARLLTQIMGRGLRLCEDRKETTPELRKKAISESVKPSCLYLDYTTDNMETHFPDGDIFSPEIRAQMIGGESVDIECSCPDCATNQIFKARKNPDGYESDEHGYFIDLMGHRIQTEYGPIPSHSGRKCQGLTLAKDGTYKGCNYRWTFKACPHCDEPNDIAAKYCISCKGEIVDPGKVLMLEFKALKRDPTKIQTDAVTNWTPTKTISRSGKPQWKIDVVTPYRSFTFWVASEPQSSYQWAALDKLMGATQGMKDKPETVTYQKNATSGFYDVIAYNREADVAPT